MYHSHKLYSGCSTAFFLRQTFGDHVLIIVFEKTDQKGGRLNISEFNGQKYELGGSSLHEIFIKL